MEVMEFAYIDDAVTAATTRVVPEVFREEAKTNRVIAGFHLPDPTAENERVDAAVIQRMADVERFAADRIRARTACTDRGIKALAVIPSIVRLDTCIQPAIFALTVAGAVCWRAATESQRRIVITVRGVSGYVTDGEKVRTENIPTSALSRTWALGRREKLSTGKTQMATIRQRTADGLLDVSKT